MKVPRLTDAESADELIKQLVWLRLSARRVIRAQQIGDAYRETWDRIKREEPSTARADAATALIADLEDQQVDLRFALIEIGNYLPGLCTALDATAKRGAVLDALEVNPAERDTELMRQYGDKISHVICVLDLENSATKDDDIAIRPLKWCHTMAFMHALQTNEKLDRVVHEEANAMFGGAFGEYRPRPLTERLVGRAV